MFFFWLPSASSRFYDAEHPKEIWLHHTLVGPLPGGTAPANGQPVPQLPGGDDVALAVPHRAAGRRDGEAALHASIYTAACVCVSCMACHVIMCVCTVVAVMYVVSCLAVVAGLLWPVGDSEV